MEEYNVYKSRPSVKKQMDECIKGYNDVTFYREVDEIQKASNLSEEMRLVLEYFMRFQWIEDRCKELLEDIYRVVGDAGTVPGLVIKTTKEINSHNFDAKSIVDTMQELGLNLPNQKATLDSLAKRLDSLSITRNRVAHHVYRDEIIEKKHLKSKIIDAMKRLRTLETDVRALENIFGSIYFIEKSSNPDL